MKTLPLSTLQEIELAIRALEDAALNAPLSDTSLAIDNLELAARLCAAHGLTARGVFCLREAARLRAKLAA